ncbi:MAG: DinB family protein [Bryobacteraceae bacterium]
MKFLLIFLCVGALCTAKPPEDPTAGLWQGYAGEWDHVSRQLIDLANAFPESKLSWRPSAGVRSTSEVLMHVAIANYMLLSVTGQPMPVELKSATAEKSIATKSDVISWLSRSLDAVKKAHAGLTSSDMQRKVSIAGKTVTADGIYLRLIVHANEHMGQLIAYARVNGVAPPWSQAAGR